MRELDLSELEGQAADTNSEDSEEMQTQEDGISQTQSVNSDTADQK